MTQLFYESQTVKISNNAIQPSSIHCSSNFSISCLHLVSSCSFTSLHPKKRSMHGLGLQLYKIRFQYPRMSSTLWLWRSMSSLQLSSRGGSLSYPLLSLSSLLQCQVWHGWISLEFWIKINIANMPKISNSSTNDSFLQSFIVKMDQISTKIERC